MNIGDTVTWTSQSQASTKTKTGVIVDILPVHQQPSREKYPDLWRGAGCGMGRRHISFVVRVGNRHYWPRVSLLSETREELVQ